MRETGYCPRCYAPVETFSMAETFHCRKCGCYADTEYLLPRPWKQAVPPEGQQS